MSEDKDQGIYNLTSPVQSVFPNLIEPRAVGPKGKEQGKPKYSLNFVFDPDSEDLAKLKSLAAKLAKAKWPSRDLKELRFPFSNGDKLADKQKAKGKDAEFYRGKVVLVSRSQYEPRLSVIQNGGITDLEGDARVAAKGKFYHGVEVLAQVNLVAYDGVGEDGKDGVTAYLNMVLSTNKGDKLSGGASAAEVFSGYAGVSTTEDPTEGSDLDDEIPF